jgi:hypothetical protein
MSEHLATLYRRTKNAACFTALTSHLLPRAESWVRRLQNRGLRIDPNDVLTESFARLRAFLDSDRPLANVQAWLAGTILSLSRELDRFQSRQKREMLRMVAPLL